MSINVSKLTDLHFDLAIINFERIDVGVVSGACMTHLCNSGQSSQFTVLGLAKVVVLFAEMAYYSVTPLYTKTKYIC